MTDKSSRAVIFSCSGGSNCGQITNQIGVKLTDEGLGNMSCLAGIGAHDQNMINNAKSAKKVLAVDGCAVACAKKTLEHAGIHVTHWVCVTDHGIEKTPNKFDMAPEEIALVLLHAKKEIG